MAELSTHRTRLGMGRGSAWDKEKNQLRLSRLHETKVRMKKTSLPDKPPLLETAVPGMACTAGSYLGDEVRVLQTGKLQDWLLDRLYIQGCLGSWLLLNEVQ